MLFFGCGLSDEQIMIKGMKKFSMSMYANTAGLKREKIQDMLDMPFTYYYNQKIIGQLSELEASVEQYLSCLCFDCRIAQGFKRKDKGAHTASVKACSECGEQKPILPSRHWVSN